jgi:hypothetical protein
VQVTNICLKKPHVKNTIIKNAKQCENIVNIFVFLQFSILSYKLSTNTAKIVARIFRRRIAKKTLDVLGEDLSGFRRGKGTRDAIGIRMNFENSQQIVCLFHRLAKGL